MMFLHDGRPGRQLSQLGGTRRRAFQRHRLPHRRGLPRAPIGQSSSSAPSSGRGRATDAAEELQAALEALGPDTSTSSRSITSKGGGVGGVTAPGGAARYTPGAKQDGVVRRLGVTSHQRQLAARIGGEGLLDLVMVRYNRGPRGAERDVFPVTESHGLASSPNRPALGGAAPADARRPAGFWSPAPRLVPASSCSTRGRRDARRTRAGGAREDLRVLEATGPLPDGSNAALTEHGERVRRHAGVFNEPTVREEKK